MRRLLVTLAVGSVWMMGCECSEPAAEGDGGPQSGMDSGARPDGSSVTDASAPPDGEPVDDGGLTLLDGAVRLPDGAILACTPAACQGRLYQCGNCLDDDGDGLTDSEDPDCLGPCDNNEAGLNLLIPGIGATCNRDCYFDQDSGNGNDGCSYSLLCDPLSPGTRPSGSSCDYAGRTCRMEEADQPPVCLELCAPLVPNGCDCFGCCEIPGGSGNFVFAGSTPEAGAPPCTIATADDPRSCRPCTPNMACFNSCERCELCLGRTELPADCFPPPPVDAGTLPDGGIVPTPDGGTPPPRCTGDAQPCGLPGDAPCPRGEFCLTGCCIFFG